MPHDVGKYQQGGHLTQPDYQTDEAGVPTVNGSVAAGQRSASPTPRAVNPVELQESIKHVGANAIRK